MPEIMRSLNVARLQGEGRLEDADPFELDAREEAAAAAALQAAQARTPEPRQPIVLHGPGDMDSLKGRLHDRLAAGKQASGAQEPAQGEDRNGRRRKGTDPKPRGFG